MRKKIILGMVLLFILLLSFNVLGNCIDGIDNDRDGYTDLNDAGCLDARDASEREYGLQLYVAEDIDEMPRVGRDLHQASADAPGREQERQYPDVDMREILTALADVLRRAEMFESHHIEREKLSTRERMSQVLERLRDEQFIPFVSLFKVAEGRLGVVVTFLAVMELIKESLIEIVQNEPFGPIHIKARAS